MVRKIELWSLIPIIITLFTSCLTVEADIVINSDGSGKADLQYNMSTLAMDISQIDDKKQILPFPIILEEYEEAALNSGGILFDYNSRDDGTRYYINSEVTFDSLENLSQFTGIQLESETVGNNTLFSVELYSPPEENPVSEQSIDLIKEKFPNEYFSLRVTIPGDIIRVEGATFSGSDVSFQINVDDLLSSREPVGFSVEYR